MDYIDVGPTKDLSVTVTTETFDTGFKLASIFLFLIIFITVGVLLFYAYQYSKLPPPPAPLNIQSSSNLTLSTNYGAAPSGIYSVNKKYNVPEDGSHLTTKRQCENAQNATWRDNKCTCNPPFFGPSCNREKHDKKYFAVGIPDEYNMRVTILDRNKSNGKSFNNNGNLDSCSDRCDKHPDCNGFIYNDSLCTLLSGDVIIPEGDSISYSHDVESTLYMKNGSDLHFEGKIILAEAPTTVPSRYWLIKETNTYAQIIPDNISRIMFAPEFVKMKKPYTGIYCRYPFTIDQIHTIIQRGPDSECYIHLPGTNINLPPDWRYKTPLYVTYTMI